MQFKWKIITAVYLKITQLILEEKVVNLMETLRLDIKWVPALVKTRTLVYLSRNRMFDYFINFLTYDC